MSDIFDVTDKTWPAADHIRAGAFLIRIGKGGGQRVSSATAVADWTEADIALAEETHKSQGQRLLFMVRPEDQALDLFLEQRGYSIVDPVVAFMAEISSMAIAPPPMTAFCIWPPLEIMRDLWADGGITAARIAVMERANQPKTTILGRSGDRAAGVAFVAIHDEIAMLHALHVSPDQRRQGTAVNIMRAAAVWAQDHGAKRFSVVVTRANMAANTLYTSLGMHIVGHYHYRSK